MPQTPVAEPIESAADFFSYVMRTTHCGCNQFIKRINGNKTSDARALFTLFNKLKDRKAPDNSDICTIIVNLRHETDKKFCGTTQPLLDRKA